MFFNKKFELIDAILSLNPTAEVTVRGEDIEWISPSIPSHTISEINAELIRLQKEYNQNEYQRLRALEYPPVTDYLDAVVKGDLEQQQAYIDACLAVKAKYPKPKGV